MSGPFLLGEREASMTDDVNARLDREDLFRAFGPDITTPPSGPKAVAPARPRAGAPTG